MRARVGPAHTREEPLDLGRRHLRGRLLISMELLPVVGPEGVRAFAERSGLSPGTVSDLINGKTGPPLPKNAARIDAIAGTQTESISRSAREQATAIRKESIERAASLVGQPGPVHDRLAAVTLLLASDDELLSLVEHVATLPEPIREGLGALVTRLGPPR